MIKSSKAVFGGIFILICVTFTVAIYFNYRLEHIALWSIKIFIIVTLLYNIQFPSNLFTGLKLSRAKAYDFIMGAIITTMVFLLSMYLMSLIHVLRFINDFPQIGIRAIAQACLVGFFEELIFRAYILESLGKRFNSQDLSIHISNLIYVIMHSFYYMKIPKIYYADLFNLPWIINMFEHIKLLDGFLMGFIGLYLFGLILSYAYVRTKAIYLGLGVHVIAVLYLKSSSSWVSYTSIKENFPIVFGYKYIYQGLLGWGILLLLFISIYFYTKLKPNKPS